ncbi:methionine--tRNA ligase [Emiliania huxleyi CCMP1516]|uniref:methionine--tRNA ligase n=2 Tax=Emiliania huxleyi TaxID=2903 RepID=A0A0D3KEF7_EMIH1|nr:methionine--tRNA ligase [Emiliania huxleyi CCMP1516]EOD34142.1 methionine--tRNA ligase [Emiliania huxleyi CCMP1516]|eukprot:XP_005786571.1 methionine--tRNA ligase [Emiliania huxleyi CCMP1516]
MLLGLASPSRGASLAAARASRALRVRSGRAFASASAVAKEPRFITTPIYYVNGQPHIGHVYTSLACDVVARFSRLDGHKVLFLTGTDEHGQKVEQSACKAGESPQDFADRVSDTFRALLPLYDFSVDQFIRTTEARHKEAAAALWSALVESGDLYLGAYEGWYSVRDECFYTEEELVDGNAPTGAEVEWVAESSYFFRLSRYRQRLEEHLLAKPTLGVSRCLSVLAFMRDGLRDLSVSRTTFTWGVPVPGPPPPDGLSHVMYVWLDALTNYLTALGYPDTEAADFRSFWPASLHVVGKDILRFHAIYWPAFLMAAGLPLPKRLFAHGWWMNEGEKMSKSVGNVVDPVALVQRYGPDPVRHFLLSDVTFGADGDFSEKKLVESSNAKLANEPRSGIRLPLGNLAYRTLSFTQKQCGGAVPAPDAFSEDDLQLLAEAAALLPQLRTHVDSMALHRYSQGVSGLASAANRYIDVQAPWALKKSEPARMRTVLYVLIEVLRHLALYSQPVTPRIGAALLEQLGARSSRDTAEA